MANTEKGFQRLTMGDAAQLATIPVGTTHYILRAEVGDIRVCRSGTATATVGDLTEAGTGTYVAVNPSQPMSVYGATGSFASITYVGNP